MKSTIFPLKGRGELIERQEKTQELSKHKEIEIACIPTIMKVRKEGGGVFIPEGCLLNIVTKRVGACSRKYGS